MAKYEKPVPLADEFSTPFWEGCRRHVLLMQKCPDCGRYCLPAKAACPSCGGWSLQYVPVSGRGKVSSYVIYHRNFLSAFANDLPYAVVKVALEEQDHLEMLSNVVGCALEMLQIGMPVTVVFDDVDNEFTLPKFRPVT